MRHLNGARALAQHVSNGGNLYDDFGKHIVSLSEELGKREKYRNRNFDDEEESGSDYNSD